MPVLEAILDRLVPCSRNLDGHQTRTKRELLRAAAACRLDEPKQVIRYHDCLLFLAAFPDNVELRRRAEDELARIAREVSHQCAVSRRIDRLFRDSGVAGSQTSMTPSFDLLQWLLSRGVRDVEAVWDQGALSEEAEQFVPHLAAPVEYDGTVDPRLSMREWLQMARGTQTEVQWLAEQMSGMRDRARMEPAIFEETFEQLHIEVCWRMRRAVDSRTLCRFPARRLFVHTGRARIASTPPNPASIIRQLLPPLRFESARSARRLIDTARCVLAARGRETDPVTYANPKEVSLVRLDRGVDVLLLGLQPLRRLPIESFIGYVAARNRIPIAYGGAWIAFDQCTIGINVFESFRGGESANLFAQILRVYVQHFRIRRVFVDPYQFGQDNDEAIKSGAFWFYYRLGFRPTEPSLASLAQREAARIAAERGHRTSARLLRRLAEGAICLEIAANGAPAPAPINLGDLSLAVTRWIGRRFDGSRPGAIAWCESRVSRILKASDQSRWSGGERRAFSQWSVLVAMIPDLESWQRAECDSLVRLMRAKGGPREADFLRRLRNHQRFRAAITAIAHSYAGCQH